MQFFLTIPHKHFVQLVIFAINKIDTSPLMPSKPFFSKLIVSLRAILSVFRLAEREGHISVFDHVLDLSTHYYPPC